MACVVDIYRSLSGDVTTAEEALAGEASLIARKRDQANNTPSAPFRRWMAEPPLNKLSAGRMGYASSGYVSEALYDNRSSFHCTLRGDYGGGGSPMRALKSTRAPIPSADVLVRPITPTRSISTPKRRGHGGRSVSPRTKWDPHGTLYTSPGPGDYEQREKTLSQRIFDQSATPLGIHGRPIRKSASFALAPHGHRACLAGTKRTRDRVRARTRRCGSTTTSTTRRGTATVQSWRRVSWSTSLELMTSSDASMVAPVIRKARSSTRICGGRFITMVSILLHCLPTESYTRISGGRRAAWIASSSATLSVCWRRPRRSGSDARRSTRRRSRRRASARRSERRRVSAADVSRRRRALDRSRLKSRK